ncbi:glycoside hydrolase family 13 protein [Gloeophyllum trabeum ATCC 11539]|uniref:Glycoside hydrolase family 13 protein n=1 Tax=Gloeophyllum trabeum (strain ATCC 11539 / FP-39264 / Madison 617) TaxID=670483 RepID=S7RIG1_GLOTA|nr:glycoside hydrolase family 13 protein [Gloeophyllum trabeum ATCC 11539]EPQ54105.1 glycoside hydrolase family 13 protein [Gloeophyllum trabeum ATCC 11539]
MNLGPDADSEDNQNPLMIQFFTWDSKHTHMSWWEHFQTQVPALQELGVTQVWLPPPNKAMDSKRGRGYDAYDLWDLGEFPQKGSTSTRWGTKDQLLSAIASAREHKIDVLVDAVLNHKMGADRSERFVAVPVAPDNRLKDIGPPREIEAWTAFDFPGRGDKYSSMRWTHEHFTGIDWDHLTKNNAVYRIPTDRRKGWSHLVDNELGNYDYLMGADIDHNHPEVREDIFAWGPWVLDTTGAAGFRLDAIKHIDRGFLLEFRMFAVAEYWSANIKLILPYIKAFQGQVAFFDVPLHGNFHRASHLGHQYDLRTIFDNSIVKYRPGDAVTFVDNHDTQIGQSLESWVGDNFKLQAYALILLHTGGHPCVFYGDLYPNTECYNKHIALKLAFLMRARKVYAYGSCIDYFKSRNCIGFVRTGDKQHDGCAVVLSNAQLGTHDAIPGVRMNVGVHNAGLTFVSYLVDGKLVPIDAEGWGLFPCPKDVEVWVKRDGEQ